MNVFFKCFCRIYQTFFRIVLPILPYREPKILESLGELPSVLGGLSKRSVLLVTDKFLRESEHCKILLKGLSEKGIVCAVYDDTRPNPTVANVNDARALYISEGCDAIIALGGGSCIDCAKAVGALIAYPKRELSSLKGLLRVWRRIPTLVAIPTTAGTGSEVTVTAVITDPEKKHKYTMNNFTTIPHYAVLDPEITYTLPKSLTATTGMDALTHAVEAYIGRSTTRETRELCHNAVRLIFENIEAAYVDGNNREAREAMLRASYMAGAAFTKSYVGYIHAVAHSLGGEYNVPHGLANAVLMPIVLEMYGESVHKKLWELGRSAGVVSEADSIRDGAKKLIEAIRAKNRAMGIPEKISGIKKEDIDRMAGHAAIEANPLYPVPVLWGKREIVKIYESVMEE